MIWTIEEPKLKIYLATIKKLLGDDERIYEKIESVFNDLGIKDKPNEAITCLICIFKRETEKPRVIRSTPMCIFIFKIITCILDRYGNDEKVRKLLPDLASFFEDVSFGPSPDFTDDIRMLSAHTFGIVKGILGGNDLWSTIEVLYGDLQGRGILFDMMLIMAFEPISKRHSDNIVRILEVERKSNIMTCIISRAIEIISDPRHHESLKNVCIAFISHFQRVQSTAIAVNSKGIISSMCGLAGSKTDETKFRVCIAFEVLINHYTEYTTPHLDLVIKAVKKIDQTSEEHEIIKITCSIWKKIAKLDSSHLRDKLITHLPELVSAILKHLANNASLHQILEQHSAIEDSSDGYSTVVTVFASVYKSKLTSILLPQLEPMFDSGNLQDLGVAIQALSAATKGGIDELLSPEFPKFIQYFVKAMESENDNLCVATCQAVYRLPSAICNSVSASLENQLPSLFNSIFSFFRKDKPLRARLIACGALLTLIKNSKESNAFPDSVLPSMIETISPFLFTSKGPVLEDTLQLISDLLDYGSELLDPRDCKICADHLSNYFKSIIFKIANFKQPISLPSLRCLEFMQKYHDTKNQQLTSVVFKRCMKIASDWKNGKDEDTGDNTPTYNTDQITVVFQLITVIVEHDGSYADKGDLIQFLLFYFEFKCPPQQEDFKAAAYDLMIAVLKHRHELLHAKMRDIFDAAMKNIIESEKPLEIRSVTVINFIETKWPGQNQDVLERHPSIKDKILRFPEFPADIIITIVCIAIVAPKQVAASMDLLFYNNWLCGIFRLEDSDVRNFVCTIFCKCILLKLGELEEYTSTMNDIAKTIYLWKNPVDKLKELFNQINVEIIGRRRETICLLRDL